MEKYLPILSASSLFSGVEADSLLAMLHCLSPRIMLYHKDEIILHAGENTRELAIVLEGEIHILHEDFWGNRNILSALSAGDLFAESFAAAQNVPLNISVLAVEDSQVMFLNLTRVLSTCSNVCPHHRRIIENLISSLAEKNRRLNEKLAHLSQRSIREKLLSYLSAEAVRRGSATFELPFNRQELADYLSVDRSALSAELSKLKREGLVDYHRSSFKILRR